MPHAAQAVTFYQQFEISNVAPSPEAARLFNATIGVLGQRLPAPLRPLIRPIMAVLIDDTRMASALGLSPAPRLLTPLVFAALRARAALTRPPRNDVFTPGRSGHTMYPDGYQLDDLGPQQATE